MDFSDDLHGEVRLVDISFESIDPATQLSQSESLSVTLNGDTYTSQLRSTSFGSGEFIYRHGFAVHSDEIDLDFYVQPGSDCCHDLKIGFAMAAGESFGLDNVVVDWSRVPEPSSLVIWGIGLAVLSVPRRGTHTRA
jgi:hypothetical protein